MSTLVRRERGQVMLMVVFLLPILLLILVSVVDIIQSVTGGDTTTQEALAEATRAAAMQVNPESLAMGHPRIDAASALTAFQTILSKDLGLDPNTMQPLPGSPIKNAPSWELIVYNGDNSYGEPSCYEYVFQDGSLTSGELAASGIPETFGICPMNITPGGGGQVQTTLNMPGCIAVISTQLLNAMNGGDLAPVRFAAARIACQKGGCSY